MHGIIFLQLAKFVRENLGADAWLQMVTDAGVPTAYSAQAIYPDAQLETLLADASERARMSREQLLETFGEFIVPRLLDIYVALIPPAWGLFDLLENVESVIHTVVRLRDRQADPPYLNIERLGQSEVTIHYGSARRMCSLGKGIIKGLALHYEEPVAIGDDRCMLRGDEACDIRVVAASTAGSRSADADGPRAQHHGLS